MSSASRPGAGTFGTGCAFLGSTETGRARTPFAPLLRMPTLPKSMSPICPSTTHSPQSPIPTPAQRFGPRSAAAVRRGVVRRANRRQRLRGRAAFVWRRRAGRRVGGDAGGRSPCGTHRRGRSDRRPGAHVSDADGRDSDAESIGKRWPVGRADRARPAAASDTACWPAIYILQAAINLLEDVRDSKLRLDRTIEVSVINLKEKTRLLKVLTPNLRTLRHLMLENKRDFVVGHRPAAADSPATEGLAAAALPPRGRRSGLSRSWGLRTQRLQPLLEKLQQISQRMARDPSATGRSVAATRTTLLASQNCARSCAT